MWRRTSAAVPVVRNILVLADPPAATRLGRFGFCERFRSGGVPKRVVRRRECPWPEHLERVGGPEPEIISVKELEDEGSIVRLATRPHKTGRIGIAVLAWDAANGDAACASDKTLSFFRNNGALRLRQLMQNPRTVFLCELQSVSGMPLQSAYDAIFGEHEATVASLTKRESGSLVRPAHSSFVGGFCLSRVSRWVVRRHPLVLGMPDLVAADYTHEGPVFHLKNRNAGVEDQDALWRGWFTKVRVTPWQSCRACQAASFRPKPKY